MIKINGWYVPQEDAALFERGLSRAIHDVQSSNMNHALTYVKKFENAIDIGTWIGDTLYPLSKFFTNVIGFEANREVFQCCEANIKEHKLDNCKMINCALSNKIGQQIFLNQLNQTFSGWIDTLDLSEQPSHNTKIVESKTLDYYGFTDIDFVKIDVDSHEGFLLEGAIDFLQKNSPVIQIEIKHRIHNRQNASMPDPIRLLESLNYRLVGKVSKADYIFVKD